VVRSDGEGGLLGLAFSPSFRTSPYLWVAFTASDGSLNVGRLRAPSPSATSVGLSTLRHVMSIPHPTYNNHYGGQLAFGPDRMLYFATGDGGGTGDPKDNARRLDRLLGKILRIDALRSCGTRRYCVPASNPFVGRSGARGEIWLYGLRNPWRFSHDPVTRWLYVADVGQARYEEITVLGSGVGGYNLGWPCREGRVTYDASRCPTRGLLNPQHVYGRGIGGSVTGGYVYRGARYRALLSGIYVFGDFISGRVLLWRLGYTVAYSQGQILPNVTSFGEDAAGEIWAVTIDGRLWRMRAVAR
jgi:glucose/arabinose dehydrogenase